MGAVDLTELNECVSFHSFNILVYRSYAGTRVNGINGTAFSEKLDVCSTQHQDKPVSFEYCMSLVS